MPTNSQAIVLAGVGEPFELLDVVVGDPQAGEVLIKMIASGICHSDLAVQAGNLPAKFPCALGHEGAGIVEAIGEGVEGLEVGDKVLLSFDYCGSCKQCDDKHPAGCAKWFPLNYDFTRPDGSLKMASSEKYPEIAGRFFGQSSLAAHSLVAYHCCTKVDPSITLEELALYSPLGCGIQTGAGAVLNVLKPTTSQSIGVWGLGGVGISAISASSSLHLPLIIGVDIVPSRLALSKEFGATHALDGRDPELQKKIKELTGGKGLDFTVEATGVPACIGAAYEALGLYGKHAQVGVPPFGVGPPIDLIQHMLLQKSFLGIMEGDSNPPVFLPELISMHKSGQIPLEKMSKVYALKDFQEAINDMKSGAVIKPIISFD